MEIINGKLYKEIKNIKSEDKYVVFELTLYKEVVNISNNELPEYKETGKSLGILEVIRDRKPDPFSVIYKGEKYSYMNDAQDVFKLKDIDHVRICFTNGDVKKVLLDHKALTYIGLLCGARHDMAKTSELNISNETTNIELFVMVNNDGNVIDILYTHDIEIWDLKRHSDIEEDELVSLYNTDIRKYPRNIVTKIIEDYLLDEYQGNDLSKVSAVRLDDDIELELVKRNDETFVIIHEEDLNKLPKNIKKFDVIIEFNDCCDRHVSIELPRKPFPTKEGPYSMNNDNKYVISITELVGAAMYHEIFSAMSYNLEHGDVFDWGSYEDIVGIDCPAINLYDGIYIDLIRSENPIIQRFYAQDRSAYDNVWEIYNCDKFERLWLAYIDTHGIDKM